MLPRFRATFETHVPARPMVTPDAKLWSDRPAQEPPMVEQPWSSLVRFRRNPLAFLTAAAARHGDVVAFGGARLSICLVRHPDLVQRVFVDHHRNYDKKTRGFDALRFFLGNGLLTSEGDFWRRQRRIAQPSFHRRRIADFAESMVELTEEMLTSWATRDPAQPFDLAEAMADLTLRIVSRTLLSTDVTDDDHSIGHGVGRLNVYGRRYMSNPFALAPTWPTPANREFHRITHEIDRVVLGIIEGRRRTGSPPRPDLLSMLMDARDAQTGEAMTDRQLRDEVMTIFVAGHETTANALAWTFYLLSQSPRVTRTVLEELDRVVGARSVALDDLPALETLGRVVKESLRLYPPAWTIGRRTVADDVMGGYRIRAGTLVMCAPWVTHRDPRFWPDPEGFDPDRFHPERERQQHRYAYFPFGGGPRTCIGNSFASMELALVLATVLRRFVPNLVAGHPVEPEPLITLRPRYGLRVTLQPRA